MSKVILLGSSGTPNFDVKVQKWNYILLGGLFLLQGGNYLYGSKDGAFDKFMMYLMFYSGMYAIAFALINFSRSSKFAPKVIVDESKTKFKRSLLKKKNTFNWQDIQSIRFKSFRIDFKTVKTVEILSYDCTSDISIDVKEAIREMAEKKNIEVIGG